MKQKKGRLNNKGKDKKGMSVWKREYIFSLYCVKEREETDSTPVLKRCHYFMVFYLSIIKQRSIL